MRTIILVVVGVLVFATRAHADDCKATGSIVLEIRHEALKPKSDETTWVTKLFTSGAWTRQFTKHGKPTAMKPDIGCVDKAIPTEVKKLIASVTWKSTIPKGATSCRSYSATYDLYVANGRTLWKAFPCSTAVLDAKSADAFEQIQDLMRTSS